MRILRPPDATPEMDIDWSFRPVRSGGRWFMVLCCSLLVSHNGDPPERTFDDRATAHRAALRKTSADFLVRADAWARPGTDQAAPGVRVAIEFGGRRKELAAFGDRAWHGSHSLPTVSPPEPFVSMPIGWERAFGGPGHAANPLGRGLGSGEHGRKLPNIERPEDRVHDPASRPEPAGFGPVDPFWAPRIGMMGTFDDAWLAERWPDMPANFDPRFWNEAPPDQQFSGGFRGDETMAFENLHPERPRLESRLPGRRARAFLAFVSGDFRELPMVLDTVDVDVLAGQTELLWRGAERVASPRAREIDFLFVQTESLDAAADLAAYRVRFEAMRRAEYPTEDEQRADGAAAEATRVARATERDSQREAMLAGGKARLDEAMSRARDMGRKASTPIDFDAAASAVPPGDPHAAMSSAVAALGERDPAKAAEIGAALNEAMKRAPSANAWTRERVEAAALAAEDMSDSDLTGLDLSGLELDGARLAKARLLGANLLGASFLGADLTGADLSGAEATNADFANACLAGARFADATLIGARFVDADVTRATFSKVVMAGLRFDRAHGEDADFTNAILTGVSFRGATLPRSAFSGAMLEDTQWDGASLVEADFSNTKAAGSSFVAADLTNMRAFAADFRVATFIEAICPRGFFQKANLAGADFSRATLSRAIFSEANLQRASFDRAFLEYANFDDAVLRGAALTFIKGLRASFERADLSGANFSGANLYQAGFHEARSTGTRFANCMVAGTLLAS